MKTPWIHAACVLSLAVVLGCKDKEQAPSGAPAATQRASQVQATYQGRTAQQWLNLLRQAQPDTPQWRQTAPDVSDALEALGPDAVAPLTEAMKDPRWHIREFCAFALGKLGDAAVPAIPVLIEAVRDENFLVTEAGEAALGNLGFSSRKALDRMVEALSSPDPFVRRIMAEQLGHLGARARPALAALEKLTKDEDPEVRAAAAEAIEEIEAAP